VENGEIPKVLGLCVMIVGKKEVMDVCSVGLPNIYVKNEIKSIAFQNT